MSYIPTDTNLSISGLAEIKPFKTSWSVRVKVLHTWISFSHQYGASLQMVLTDDKGVKIQASCSQNLLKLFKRCCVVGEWKVITNFTLRRATGLILHTNHIYTMEFVSRTAITDCNIACSNMFLDLTDFVKITNVSLGPCYLIDVIGEIVSFEGHGLFSCLRKEFPKLEFTLRDVNDNRLRCIITGKLATNLTQLVQPLKAGDICLIRFARIINYKGEIHLTNFYESSLLFVNPDIKETLALKQSCKSFDNALLKNNQVKDKNLIFEKCHKWSMDPFLTIHEMKHCDKSGHCRVICSIYAIDTITGWYYHACMVCKHAVYKRTVIFGEVEDRKWWCDFCQHSVPRVETRYKLDVLVQDQTGESIFTLQDTDAAAIVKTPAAKIVNTMLDEVENDYILPEQLVDIVGKTYGFGISFDENLNSNSSNHFKASKVWTLSEVIWKRTKSLHQNTTASRKKQCTNVACIEGTSG